MDFNVATFNMRFENIEDKDNTWGNRKDEAAEMIKKHRPAVFGTQEGLHNMLIDLQERLPNYDWIGKGREGGNKSEFNAIFFRKDQLSLLDHGQFWLSEYPQETGSKSWDAACTRICTWGDFRLKESNQTFTFFNTHLDHISETARTQGIKLIYETIRAQQKHKNWPFFLTGDFNATPESEAVQFMGSRADWQDAFTAAEVVAGATYHGFKGTVEGESIDYIFATTDVTIHRVIVDRAQINGRYPSDHYPIIAQVSI